MKSKYLKIRSWVKKHKKIVSFVEKILVVIYLFEIVSSLSVNNKIIYQNEPNTVILYSVAILWIIVLLFQTEIEVTFKKESKK